VEDELKKKGPLDVGAISTANLFKSSIALAENQWKTALADGTESPTAPNSSQAFVDLLTRNPFNPDRERCISFLLTGWASDSGFHHSPLGTLGSGVAAALASSWARQWCLVPQGQRRHVEQRCRGGVFRTHQPQRGGQPGQSVKAGRCEHVARRYELRTQGCSWDAQA